jgi:glycosyltransferase involved in cell wall biosynthesis
MKVLYLCPDLGIPVLGHKGASVHVREMTAALSEAGHEVILAAQMLNKSPWEKRAEIKVPVIQVRPGAATSSAVAAFKNFNEGLGAENSFPGELRRILYNQDLIEDLRRRFENSPPDFIYERASLYATAGVALARLFDVPLLVELNAPLAVEQSAYRATGFGELAAQAERWTLSQADAVLVVSSELNSHVLQLGISPEKIHVVPNGVNPALFRPAKPDPVLAKRLHLNGGPILGFVGGLRPWHGVEILPQLLARLARKHDSVRMVVAGEGQLRSSLKEAFESLDLADRVTFTGAMSHGEIPGVIRQFDIALAPYPRLDHHFYFSPLKLYEYMACGVAVAAAKVGQIAEVVSHGKNGLLHEPGDLDALVRNCDKLITNRKLRASLGRAAAAKIAREFTWARNAERVGALAKELIRAKRQ